MISRLFFYLVIIALLELWLLIKIGASLGALNTIILVVFTAIVGVWLAKFEGLRVVRNLQKSWMQGTIPENAMIDGLLIFIGGILLLVPGIITDVIGFLLVVPFTRGFFRSYIKKKFSKRHKSGANTIYISNIKEE